MPKMLEVTVRTDINTHNAIQDHANKCGVTLEDFIQVVMYMKMYDWKAADFGGEDVETKEV